MIMHSELRSYTVRSLDPEQHDDKVGGKDRVSISFYDALGREREQRHYKQVQPREVYDAIEQGSAIDLDGGYIFGLDLNVLRKEKGLEADEELHLPPLTAREAFFDHLHCTDLSGASFSGEKLDLAGASFAQGTVRFYKARLPEGGMDLSGAWFGEGDLDLKFAVFQEGGVDLEEASLGRGRISFVNAEFGDGAVNFRNAKLGDGDLDFHFARFSSGHVCFDGIELGEGKLDMRKADFGDGRFDMRRAYVGKGDVLFDESEFKKGKVNFRSTIFGNGDLSFRMADLGEGEVIFDKADFGEGNISFRKAGMERISFRDCHIDHYMDLRVAKAESIDLSDTVVRGLIDMIPTAQMEVGALYLIRVRNLGQLFIDWEANGVERLIEGQTGTTVREKADQYRVLKEDFTNIGQYESEDRAYVRFKRHERRAWLKECLQERPSNAVWAYPSAAFQWLVFDKMGKYATDPLRVLSSMLVVYTLFSLSYVLLPQFLDGDVTSTLEGQDLSRLAMGFYHSAITFLTIGYGDYHPTGHFRWISGVEGFMGIFLTAYFTVAFVRKILR